MSKMKYFTATVYCKVQLHYEKCNKMQFSLIFLRGKDPKIKTHNISFSRFFSRIKRMVSQQSTTYWWPTRVMSDWNGAKSSIQPLKIYELGIRPRWGRGRPPFQVAKQPQMPLATLRPTFGRWEREKKFWKYCL